jgi:RNA polymerase sigma-70 factor (ECF subfamily)
VNQKTADDKAFEAELVALIPHLRAFGRSLAGNVAQGEDLAQDALAKALAHRENFQMGTNMKAWAFMILRNQFYSDKRRSWRSTELDPEVAERTLVSREGPANAIELDELRRALAMLPDDQREALILIGAAGMSYEEVSQIACVPIGTIKSRVSRARDHLALIYAEGKIRTDHLPARAAMDAIFAQINELQHARAA